MGSKSSKSKDALLRHLPILAYLRQKAQAVETSPFALQRFHPRSLAANARIRSQQELQKSEIIESIMQKNQEP